MMQRILIRPNGRRRIAKERTWRTHLRTVFLSLAVDERVPVIHSEERLGGGLVLEVDECNRVDGILSTSLA